MEESGISVGLGGNIGAGLGPAASELALRRPAPRWLVVEISSFQLADTEAFTPDVGVLTNLAPDHLDRYPSVEAYYADKARLFNNANPESRWVLPFGSDEVDALVGEAPGRRFYFATTSVGFSGGYLEGDLLVVDVGAGKEPLVHRAELRLLGEHNVSNALAASLAARLAGASASALRAGLTTFRSLPHRLEPVADRDGVLWVNDSKATNVAAACSAIASLERPLVALLGGHDKGEDLSPLAEAVRRGVRLVVAYGEAGGRIEEALRGIVPTLRVTEFDAAVEEASRGATTGDVILLSPACSSFDQFHNYQERGDRFRTLARAVH